ncbi:hypothetical protein [Zobellella sp. DQSA1]|uniref:hypothetical protein n=1 Tax=Zobellella sp. DQSA1 TaxID=3342386 RepID=UPI0035C03761
MAKYSEATKDAWDELQEKRAKLKAASDHYDRKVLDFREDACSLEDVTQAFDDKQQASQDHAEAFHRLFKA